MPSYVESIAVSKLSCAEFDGSTVLRKELLGRFGAALPPKVILITGIAGSGKTVLASQLARLQQGRRTRVAWLTLDRSENSSHRFLLHLAAAFEFCGFAEMAQIRMLLQSSPTEPQETVIGTIVNALVAYGKPVWLVLDDVHFVTAKETLAVLGQLIRYAPKGFHVVLSSRTRPELGLARLRVAGEAIEIDGDALRFSREETRRFLEGALGPERTLPETVDRLQSKTEGWVAGLQFARLLWQERLRAGGEGVALDVAHPLVRDFITAEILDLLPGDILAFMERSAIFEQLQASACDAVLEREDSLAVLEWLSGTTQLIVSLNRDLGLYRYHSLLRDFLHLRLKRHGRLEMNRLHRRAYEHFLAQGRLSDAVHHAVQAGDEALAAKQVERAAARMIQGSELVELKEILQQFSGKMLEARPLLGLAWIWILFHMPHARRARAAERLNAARRRFARMAPPEGALVEGWNRQRVRAEIDVLKTGVLSAAERPVWASEAARKALAEVPRDYPFLHGTLNNILAYNLYALGELDGCIAVSLEGRRWHDKAGSAFGMVYSDSLMAMAETEKARHHAAVRHIENGYELARAAIGKGSYPELLLAPVRAVIHYDRDELDAAEALLRESYSALMECTTLAHVVIAAGLRARIALARGHAAEAAASLAAIRHSRETAFSPRVRSTLLYEEVFLALRSGQHDEARDRLVREGVLDGAAGGVPEALPAHRELSYFALLDYEVATRSARDLAPDFACLRQRCQAAGRYRRDIVLACMEAAWRESRGVGPAASAILAEALARAGPNGMRRPFLDGGSAIPAILNRLLAAPQTEAELSELTRGFAVGLAQRIASGTGGRPRLPKDGGGGGHGPLTLREREIAAILCQGYSNKAIARELDLSLDTVKWHLKNLYGKLGVSSRMQAAIRLQSDRDLDGPHP